MGRWKSQTPSVQSELRSAWREQISHHFIFVALDHATDLKSMDHSFEYLSAQSCRFSICFGHVVLTMGPKKSIAPRAGRRFGSSTSATGPARR